MLLDRQQHGVPPDLVYSDYPLEDASSVSQSEPLICQPQHRTMYQYQSRPQRRLPNYYKTTPTLTMVDGHPQTTQPRRQIQRSAQLQIAMNRINQRKETEEAARAEWQRREESEKVEQIVEMVSAYDAVLDHLVRKNRRLKEYVHHETNHFPTDHTMTSSAIVDTLELLRHEREVLSPSQPRQERDAIEEEPSRPLHERDARLPPTPQRPHLERRAISAPWYEQRIRHEPQRLPSREVPISGRLYAGHQHTNSAPRGPVRNERMMRSDSRFVNKPIRDNFEYENSNIETGPLNDEAFYSDEDLYHSQRQQLRRDDRYENDDRYDDRYEKDDRYDDRYEKDDRYQTDERDYFNAPIDQHTGNAGYRYDDRHGVPDPGFYRREDDGYRGSEYFHRQEVSTPRTASGERNYGDPYRQARVERRSQQASNILSQLLPENIPPKIKESRDRLTRFRRSRQQAALEYELRRQPQSPPVNLGTSTPPTNQYRHSNLRLGSPKRPYDLSELDRYNRPTVTAQHRPGTDLRHEVSRPSPVRPRMSTHTVDFQEQPRDDSSLSPSEHARELVEHVEDMYRFSKEVTESHEQMKDDLRRIQEMSHGRRNFNAHLRGEEISPLGRAKAPVRRQEDPAVRHSPDDRHPDVSHYQSNRPPPGRPSGVTVNPLEEPAYFTQLEQVQFKVKRGPNGELNYSTEPKPDKKEKLEPAKHVHPIIDTEEVGPPRQIAIVKVKKEVKSPTSGFVFPDLLGVCSDETSPNAARGADRYDPLSEHRRSNTPVKHRAGDARPSRQQPQKQRPSLLSTASSESGQNPNGHFQEPKHPDATESLEVAKAKEALYSGPIVTERRHPRKANCGCV